MIERRNRQFTQHAKSIYLAMPTNTTLDQNSTSIGNQTGRLAREFKFAAAETRTDPESLEQRQRVIVWGLIALLWILFVLAGIILWQRLSSGS
jgi:hypothetical protein